MIQQFDSVQKLGKDNMDLAVKTFGTVSKGAQTVAVEAADFAKKSFEHTTATFEKLAGAKTFDKAIEIQTDYVKGAFDAFVAQSTRMGELFANVAKDAVRPHEAAVATAPKPAPVK
jgi:hypothetical protein